MPNLFDQFLATQGAMQQNDAQRISNEFNLAKLSQMQQDQALEAKSRQLGMEIARTNLAKQANPAPNAVTLANLSDMPEQLSGPGMGEAPQKEIAQPATVTPPKQSETLARLAADQRKQADQFGALGDTKRQMAYVEEARKTDDNLYRTQAEERKADVEKKKEAASRFGAVNSQESLDAAMEGADPEQFKKIAGLFPLGLDGKAVWDGANGKAAKGAQYIARAAMDASKQAEFEHKALLDQIAAERAKTAAADLARKEAKDVSDAGFKREGVQIKKDAAAAKPDVNEDMTPDAIDSAAARYNIDGTLPPNIGRGNQGAVLTAKILSKAAEKSKASGDTPEAQRVTQVANKASQQALGQLTKQEQMVGAFEKNAIANADVALNMSEKVDRTGVPILNRWLLAGQKNITGDPDVSKFHQANETFVNEYAKIMSGSMGNTAVSDSLRKETQSMLATKDTPEQYRAVVGQMKVEMANRMKGFAAQKAELTGSMKRRVGDTPAEIPTIKGDADYAALAPGAQYIAPDGSTRTKGK